MLSNIYCCRRFAAKIGDAGTRGFAFLVGEINNRQVIILQSRGISFEDEKFIPAISIGINVATEIPISYCPFCGADLNVKLLSHPDEYKRLAIDHAPMISQFKAK